MHLSPTWRFTCDIVRRSVKYERL